MEAPKILIGQDKLVKDFVASKIKNFHDDVPEGLYSAFGIVQNDKLIAGAVFHDYRPPVSIQESFASISPTWATKITLRTLFWFPFEHCKVRRLNSLIAAENTRSRDLTERLGFKQEGVIRQGTDDGDDLIIYGMLRDECRWIK